MDTPTPTGKRRCVTPSATTGPDSENHPPSSERPQEVAGLLHEVVTDARLRAAVLATQQRAVARLRSTDFGTLLLDRLRPVLESAAPLRVGSRARSAAGAEADP